jgi:hypothetical protein
MYSKITKVLTVDGRKNVSSKNCIGDKKRRILNADFNFSKMGKYVLKIHLSN